VIAQRTADWLGVQFKKINMSEEALASRFEEATYHIEHHNCDLNFVGKFALSETPLSSGFKVVLTGEGADEQFGGYPVYLPDYLRDEDGAADLTYRAPEDIRFALAEEQERVITDAYRDMGGMISHINDMKSRAQLGNLLTPPAMAAFAPAPRIFVKGFKSKDIMMTIIDNFSPEVKEKINTKWHPLNSAMYTWSKGNLANQFLSCLGDRVEMAHSIEARTPFLDHKLTEYINSIPPSMKIRYDPSIPDFDDNGKPQNKFIEKYVLRQAVKEFVTPEIYSRRKHPYSAPTTYPLGGAIHRLMTRLVTKENVEQLGFILWEEVEGMIDVAFGVEVERREDGKGYRDTGGKRDAEGRNETLHRSWAWRQVLVVAEWVVLSQRFGIKKAIPGL